MPKVSIIIPLYNKSKYISKTIDSIQEQQFKDYELIVVNDGSTDNSLEIVKQYAEYDTRIHVLDISNGGVSNARNVGLKYAHGEWIQFLDGDDLINKEYLSNAIDIIENKNVDILFTDFWMVDEDRKLVKKIENTYQGIVNQTELCQIFMEHQYKNGFFGYISNKLIRSSLLEKSKATFPVDINLAEDLDFYAQLYPAVERACFVPIISFYYLQTETNYLNNTKIDYYSQIKVHLDIKKWFVQSQQYEEYHEYLDKKVSEYVYFTFFYANEYGDNKRAMFNRIINDPEIMKCIHPKYFKGLAKKILWAITKKNYIILELLLNSRTIARSIYRRIKIHA